MTDGFRLLNIDQVAELTGFSKGTLYHWINQRRIPYVRISARCVRFRQSDVEKWIAGMVETPGDKEIACIALASGGRK